jgi:hypothetical protein
MRLATHKALHCTKWMGTVTTDIRRTVYQMDGRESVCCKWPTLGELCVEHLGSAPDPGFVDSACHPTKYMYQTLNIATSFGSMALSIYLPSVVVKVDWAWEATR